MRVACGGCGHPRVITEGVDDKLHLGWAPWLLPNAPQQGCDVATGIQEHSMISEADCGPQRGFERNAGLPNITSLLPRQRLQDLQFDHGARAASRLGSD